MVVNVPFILKTWKDKKTGMWLTYSKKFDISAYGKTRKDARDMFVSQVYEFLKLTQR
jgi:hypothetical protein